MKTYKEMADNALNRINKYESEQKIRNKNIKAIAIPLSCLCLVSVLGIGIVNGNFAKNIRTSEEESNIQSDIIKSENNTDIQKYNKAKEEDTTAISSNQDVCLALWKDKMYIKGQLFAELDNNPEGDFKILATYHPTSESNTSFVYEGKTLAEWAVAAADEKSLPDKMYQLLKLGDSLKYGTALYETGTPDGEIWSKSHYEEVTAFFGEELLNKYIVNGEFFSEKLTHDIKNYYETSAEKTYELAYAAYIETVLSSAVKQLSENGIECQRAEKKDGIVFTVTANELENLQLDNLECWYFEALSSIDDIDLA